MLVTKRIIIAGDSWAAGEWNTDATVAHRGLQKFLTDDGHNVVNISYPGGSNLQAVERLNNYIQLNDSLLETIVFFFITEFFREIFYYPEKTSNVCNRVTVLEERKKGEKKGRERKEKREKGKPNDLLFIIYYGIFHHKFYDLIQIFGLFIHIIINIL